MARIEPIPWDEVPEDTRAMMEAGTATGMYTTPVLTYQPGAIDRSTTGAEAHA